MSGSRWRVVCCIAAVSIAAASGAARAAAPDAVVDPDTQIARRHFDRGTVLYGEEKYAEAIVEFEAARKVKPLPAFDYNIAKAHDRLEHIDDAVRAYQRYVEGAPNAADVAEVRARIAVLRQRLGETAPPPTASSTTTTPDLAPSHVASWVVGGGGVLLLAGGLVAGLITNSRYGALKNSCAPDGGCTATDAQNTIDSGKNAALATDVLLGVGIAAVAAGVVLYVVEGRRPERQAWRLLPTLSAHGGGLALEFTR